MKGTYRNPRQRHADTVRSEARAQALNNRLAMVASSTSATLAAMKPTAMVLAASTACEMEAAVSSLEAKTIGYLGCLDTPTLAPELATRVAQLPTALVPGVTPVASATAATAASTEPVIAGSAAEGAARVAFFSSRSYFTERFVGAEPCAMW